MSRDRSLAIAMGLVAAAALAAFAAALHGAFVNWDDEWLILRNPFLRSPGRILEVLAPLRERALLGAEYLPVRDLSNMLDFAFFGTEPTGYRLGNWLLHALGAALAYALLLEALRLPRAALAGALLWAVHPLHAEVVCWASARKDLLCAAFALLAATLHLRSGRTRSIPLLAAAAGAFLLAMLSKTAAASLPAVLVAWETATGDPGVPAARRLGRALLRASPMLALAAAGAFLNLLHQERAHVVAGWRGDGWLPNFFIMAGVHLRYLRQVVLPFGLAADYDVGASHPDAAANLLGAAVLAAGLAGTAFLLVRRRAAGIGGLWWFGLLLPVSNLLVPITNVSADRYLHLPLLGPCLLAGLAFERACAARPAGERAARAILAAAVVALGAIAAVQCRTWRDSVALWTRAVEISSGAGRAWMNLGEAQAFAGRTDEALDCFRRMVEAEPDNATLWIHAANRLIDLAGPGKLDEAEVLVRTAVDRAKPDNGVPFVVMGWIHHLRGRTDESVRMLEEAVRRQPDLAEAHYNLGLWHEAGGRPARAIEELGRAVKLGLALDREVDAHDRLSRIHHALGDAERARFHREERERKRALTFGE